MHISVFNFSDHLPHDLQDEWTSFAQEYISNGNKADRTKNLNLLGHLVFKLIADAQSIVKSNQPAFIAKELSNFIAQNTRSDGSDFESLRSDLWHAMTALAKSEYEELRNAANHNLACEWEALEQYHGLQELSIRANVKSTSEWQKHVELQKSQAGSLISGILLAGVNRTLHSRSRKAAKLLEYMGFTADQAYEHACDVFQSSLFRYDKDKGIPFNSYLTMRLKYNLPRLLMGETEDFVSLDARSRDGERTHYDILENEKSVGPEIIAIANEGRANIEAALQKIKPNYKEILRLRLGFTDDGIPLSVQEIGDRLGTTGENIRQIQERAIMALTKVLQPHKASEQPIRWEPKLPPAELRPEIKKRKKEKTKHNESTAPAVEQIKISVPRIPRYKSPSLMRRISEGEPIESLLEDIQHEAKKLESPIPKTRREGLDKLIGGGSLYGALLSNIRRDQNLSQADLGQKAEMSKEMIGTIESGATRVSPEKHAQLCRALQLAKDSSLHKILEQAMQSDFHVKNKR